MFVFFVPYENPMNSLSKSGVYNKYNNYPVYT
jgi:hypothetical protein